MRFSKFIAVSFSDTNMVAVLDFDKPDTISELVDLAKQEKCLFTINPVDPSLDFRFIVCTLNDNGTITIANRYDEVIISGSDIEKILTDAINQYIFCNL